MRKCERKMLLYDCVFIISLYIIILCSLYALVPHISPSQIIQRRKRSEMQTEYDFVWPQTQSLIQTSELPSPSQPQASSQGPQDPLKTSYSLWVSLKNANHIRRS